MATNELQLPPDVRERIEELDQELSEGEVLFQLHWSTGVPVLCWALRAGH